MDILNPVEVRVLGALLEKEITTPEYYPLTINALENACNQKSSREPVVNYDENTVVDALESLQEKGLSVRITGAGHRVEKFGHRLGERLNLGRRELALLCVLMLRDPQTVGELRGRTERMHDFGDLDEVERCLEALSTREPNPLVAGVARGRWVQLLGGTPDATAETESAAPLAASQRGALVEQRSALEERVAILEHDVAELKQQLESFRRQFE